MTWVLNKMYLYTTKKKIKKDDPEWPGEEMTAMEGYGMERSGQDRNGLERRDTAWDFMKSIYCLNNGNRYGKNGLDLISIVARPAIVQKI